MTVVAGRAAGPALGGEAAWPGARSRETREPIPRKPPVATCADMPVSVSTQLVPSVVHSTVVVCRGVQVPSAGRRKRDRRQASCRGRGRRWPRPPCRAAAHVVRQQERAEVAGAAALATDERRRADGQLRSVQCRVVAVADVHGRPGAARSSPGCTRTAGHPVTPRVWSGRSLRWIVLPLIVNAVVVTGGGPVDGVAGLEEAHLGHPGERTRRCGQDVDRLQSAGRGSGGVEVGRHGRQTSGVRVSVGEDNMIERQSCRCSAAAASVARSHIP